MEGEISEAFLSGRTTVSSWSSMHARFTIRSDQEWSVTPVSGHEQPRSACETATNQTVRNDRSLVEKPKEHIKVVKVCKTLDE